MQGGKTSPCFKEFISCISWNIPYFWKLETTKNRMWLHAAWCGNSTNQIYFFLKVKDALLTKIVFSWNEPTCLSYYKAQWILIKTQAISDFWLMTTNNSPGVAETFVLIFVKYENMVLVELQPLCLEMWVCGCESMRWWPQEVWA